MVECRPTMQQNFSVHYASGESPRGLGVYAHWSTAVEQLNWHWEVSAVGNWPVCFVEPQLRLNFCSIQEVFDTAQESNFADERPEGHSLTCYVCRDSVGIFESKVV